ASSSPLFLSERLLQAEGKEGEKGGPDDGPDGRGDREGSTCRARGGCLSCQCSGGRNGSDEDGAGDLPHLHWVVVSPFAGL
ncbi:unnamed protein product, partial [Musa hybrid cultivar]